ncbi:hypothetical protein COT66_01840 [Candidatus Shapirobacteria bacterium CG09_land_8_20_14_0_10_49_15]|uniref:Baseplate protein J-like domain-containing protein n=1 Tax=Candidatus Shapirobacteria bacterium CG09_land_8_20_14_0_10_49_15 TaxID=1974482 RepID=A0A2M6XAS4_9BACT|nr:MAG: hypothetical protein COT66_01840 [Candidatus Shapirobacteria bacterium CG09_land_8_20_14_0_10_49_15]
MPVGGGFMLLLPMEVKTILEKIRRSKTAEKKECFWALQIGFGLVKSAIWAVQQGLVTVLAKGETKFFQTDEELLAAIDESFAAAVDKLGAQQVFAEPNRVVLGLPRDWVKEGKIVAAKTKLLKLISKQLFLDLAGFVVFEEAVVFRLKSHEGVPPSAILVYLEKQKIRVDLVNLGKSLGSETVVRSDDLPSDLIEALSRIRYEGIFPARILLYGMPGELDAAKQALEAFNWQGVAGDQASGIPNFVHLPKTEALETDFDIQAIALAGGREIAQATGIKEVSADLLLPPEAPLVQATLVAADQAEKMGFVKDQDIIQQTLVEPKEPIAVRPKFCLPRLKLPRFALPKASWLLIAVVIFLVLGGGLTTAFWYLPKAQVTIFLTPQVLEKEFMVRLDPSLSKADKKNLALPAEEIKLVEEGQKTAPTTGTKLIGEPAKGKVTIYNGTTQAKTFLAGAEITSTSGLVFTLDEAVTVASQSGTAADPTPGQSEVNVTAAKIGTEANLAADTEFGLANFSRSDYVAKNKQALGGGTSREVQIVAKSDQEGLAADLEIEFGKDVLAKLADKLDSSQKIVEETLTSKLASQQFDHDVGEEAETVSLTAKMTFTVLAFSEADFKDLIMDEIRDAIPDGFEYKPEEDAMSFELDKVTKKGEALFTVNFKTRLLPIFAREQIQKNLAGKKLPFGEAYLHNLAHIDSFEVVYQPQALAFLKMFPRWERNISIELKVK